MPVVLCSIGSIGIKSI